MPTPPLSRETAQEAVNALQIAIDAGHPYPGERGRLGAVAVAAGKLGVNATTLNNRIRAARERFGLEPRPYEPPPEKPIPHIRPRVRVKAYSSIDEAPTYRVLAIGDTHDGPNLPDKSRFRWMARHAVETKPDRIIQIGDFATFDSLSRHDLPGSLLQKLRPSYGRDMESCEEALHAMHRETDGEIPFDLTLGNHERRVQKFEEGTAEIEGALWAPLLELFARYGVRTHDEGQYLFVGGVGFVHSPRTIMNREYGGKTINPVANDAMFSIVWGHSHRGQVAHVPKIGPPGSGVDLINLGTALPTGYVAQYAKVATTGWTWGTYDLTIRGGRVIGHTFHSMDWLEDRYGD